MKPSVSPTTVGSAIACRIAAYAAVRGEGAAIASWRRQAAPPALPPLGTLLKHADEQTVAATTAVFRAVTDFPALGTNFAEWGVIAAGNFFGRAGIAQTIQRFHQEGAWGVSPHMIPHYSLHATSGTVSQALKLHGPNFGVSGGPDAMTEAFLAAATMLSEATLPGLWLLLTGHEHEAIPQEGTVSSPICEAVALALVPECAGGPTLRLCPHDAENQGHDFLAALPPFSLSRLVDEMTQQHHMPAGSWRVGQAGWVELDAGAEERCHGD